MVEPPIEAGPEERLIYYWRRHRFLELGFDTGQAQRLAMDAADWHAAEHLLVHGCTLELAYELLT